MGQLEKYGLYVLCLLIFLIFGVTLWGAPEVNAGRKDAGKQNAAQLASPGGDGGKTNPKATNSSGGGAGTSSMTMDDLLKSAMPPKQGDKSEAKQGEKNEPKQGGEMSAGDPKTVDPKAGDPKAAAAPPAPVQRQTHRVVNGDSFTSIAIRYFKDASLAGEIARLNPKLDPLKMQLKTEVVLPTQEEVAALQNAKKAPKAGAGKAEVGKAEVGKAEVGKTEVGKAEAAKGGDIKSSPLAGADYEIRPGDTIEGISIRVYGSRNRVDDIKALNPSVTPTNMKVGARLKLPKK